METVCVCSVLGTRAGARTRGGRDGTRLQLRLPAAAGRVRCGSARGGEGLCGGEQRPVGDLGLHWDCVLSALPLCPPGAPGQVPSGETVGLWCPGQEAWTHKHTQYLKCDSIFGHLIFLH